MVRTPRNYDGTEGTEKLVSHLLEGVFKKISSSFVERPDVILAAWPKIIGKKLAGMTQAVSFEEGTLTVKVKNSTLYSLLTQHEKGRLIKALKAEFPSVSIRNITFRIG